MNTRSGTHVSVSAHSRRRRPVSRRVMRREPARRLGVSQGAARGRGFFSARITQQVETISVVTEIGRAALALGGVIAWGFAFTLIAG